jgi:hypothetical protein
VNSANVMPSDGKDYQPNVILIGNIFIYISRRIFGPKRDEFTGVWRKLDNKELNDSYSSLNIVRVIKSRRMRWTGHIASMRVNRTRLQGSNQQ